jgi:hypothetical protein
MTPLSRDVQTLTDGVRVAADLATHECATAVLQQVPARVVLCERAGSGMSCAHATHKHHRRPHFGIKTAVSVLPAGGAAVGVGPACRHKHTVPGINTSVEER